MREKIVAGQRWVSTSEPELGLGVLLESQGNRVVILFTTANEKRMFAVDSAPILRVRFKVGDEILIHTGETIIIDRVEDKDGLLIYHQENKSFCEGEL
ncbi:hypothetical protein N8495_03715, partial [Akkermansiaceae bacterium]|nr:hypothetical protein [Akkermansiaceae bacterium]MDA7539181.1 hypothetical protein [Akkermansiaceae bacterium]